MNTYIKEGALYFIVILASFKKKILTHNLMVKRILVIIIAQRH